MALLALLWVGVYWWWEPVRTQPQIQVDANPAPEASSIVDPLGRPGMLTRPVEPLPVEAPRPLATSSSALGGPTSETAGAAMVEPEFRSYVVKSGDTFERIAQRELGSRTFAGAIARANAFVDPRRLRPGRELQLPIDPTNVQGRLADSDVEPPPPMAPTEYVVQRRDTLSGIAIRVYGSARYAEELFHANRDVLDSPDDLRVEIGRAHV